MAYAIIAVIIVFIAALVTGALYFSRKRGVSTIFKAAACGDMATVKSLLKSTPNIINVTDHIGATPLLVAAENGRSEIMELLIHKGADVMARGNLGTTAIHWAAEKGFYEVIELLINKGADVNAKDTLGAMPLHYAVEKGHREIVKLLISFYAELNVNDNAGNTPLSIAIARGNKDLAELLRLNGAEDKKEAAPKQ